MGWCGQVRRMTAIGGAPAAQRPERARRVALAIMGNSYATSGDLLAGRVRADRRGGACGEVALERGARVAVMVDDGTTYTRGNVAAISARDGRRERCQRTTR